MTTEPTPQHQDLLGTLALHRHFLTTTANGLSDEQARMTPTASALSVGGTIGHVAATEREWVKFILEGAVGYEDEAEHGPDSFVMAPGQTLDDVLANYAEVAANTAKVIESLNDLDASQVLPPAPWFPPGAAWSVRRVLLHLIAETAQHAGHADIIRETIDGAKTMG